MTPQEIKISQEETIARDNRLIAEFLKKKKPSVRIKHNEPMPHMQSKRKFSD